MVIEAVNIMFYVREIENHNNILAFGHSEAGKYIFPVGFEEVEGELPEGYLTVSIPTISEKLSGMLDSATNQDTPVELRVAVRKLRIAVSDALQAGKLDEALYLIENPDFLIPEEFQSLQNSLISVLQEEIG